MRLLIQAVIASTLLTCVSNVIADSDASPKLPDQYAEVVLRVEGMI